MQNPPAAAQSGAPTTAVLSTATPVGGYTAREMYEAAQLQRRLLRDQLTGAEGQREEIARQLRLPDVAGADKAGLEQRLQDLDLRVLDLQKQYHDAQQREVQTAAVPGASTRSVQERNADRAEAFIVGATIVTVVLGIPLALAYARRLWRKSAVTVSITPELDRRLDGIERAIETTAVEVERIGEGQRFVTQLLASRSASDPAQLPPIR